MKLFILICVLFNSGVSYYPDNPRSYLIVTSPKQAAIELWEKNLHGSVFDRWSGELYLLNFKDKTLTKIDIPEISFKQPHNQCVEPTGKPASQK